MASNRDNFQVPVGQLSVVSRRGIFFKWATLIVLTVLPLINPAQQRAKEITDMSMSSQNHLKTVDGISRIEIHSGPSTEPTHAIIWLHGLGATADDFVPIIPFLNLDPSLSVKFVFPQAPDRPITINGGLSMPGWYDIKGLSIADKQDAQGMAESSATVATLIAELNDQGIRSENILLAGFSQGGAVIYHQALRHHQKLSGLIALSTYLPFAEDLENEASDVNRSIPILINHGQFDPVVPLVMGEVSANKLKSLGYPVQWHVYQMEHEVIMEQIKALGAWINNNLTN